MEQPGRTWIARRQGRIAGQVEQRCRPAAERDLVIALGNPAKAEDALVEVGYPHEVADLQSNLADPHRRGREIELVWIGGYGEPPGEGGAGIHEQTC